MKKLNIYYYICWEQYIYKSIDVENFIYSEVKSLFVKIQLPLNPNKNLREVINMLILRKDETGVTVKLSHEEYTAFKKLMSLRNNSKVTMTVTKDYPVGMVGK